MRDYQTKPWHWHAQYSWPCMLKVAPCTVVQSYIQFFWARWVTTILYNYGAKLCELHYKSSNTFKLLISMSPILHVKFLSQLYKGSISDKEIVKAGGFLEELQLWDAAMANKGFNKQDYLALHETILIAPPVMKKNNVSSVASTATRCVVTARVHIERIIKRLKSFNFFSGVVPLTCKPYISSAVTVCAILVNLQPSLINETWPC